MKKIIVLICALNLQYLSAREVAVSGVIKDSTGAPAIRAVSLSACSPNSDPKLLKWGVSATDGTYSISGDVGTASTIVVTVNYSFGCSVLRRIILEENKDAYASDFMLPSSEKVNVSVKIKILENSTEIDYSGRLYSLGLSTAGDYTEGRAVGVAGPRLDPDINKIYDLPNGNYLIVVFLKKGGQNIRKESSVTVDGTTKEVTIEY